MVVDMGWVNFDLDVPPACPVAHTILPNSRLPKQNRADSGMTKIIANPTQPRSATIRVTLYTYEAGHRSSRDGAGGARACSVLQADIICRQRGERERERERGEKESERELIEGATRMDTDGAHYITGTGLGRGCQAWFILFFSSSLQSGSPMVLCLLQSHLHPDS